MPLLPAATVAYTVDALWLLFALYWAIFAFNNKRTVRRQSSLHRWAYILILPIGVLVVQQIPALHRHLFSPTVPTQLAGLLLCAAGVAFAIWARCTLGKNWSGLVTVKQDHELIQTGPYGFFRHPIYTGITLAFAGTVLAELPTLPGVLYLLLMIVALAMKAHQEERFMLEQFPDAYPAYRRRVRTAFLPLLY